MAKNLFISGASSGIGHAFALQGLSSERLILTGRSQEALDSLKNEVLKSNGNLEVVTLPCDLTDQSQLNELIKKLEEFDIDMAILNAGGGFFGPFLENSNEEIEHMIGLNITANVKLSRALAPILNRSGSNNGGFSDLIIIASHAAYMRVPNFAVYASCKSFLWSFALTIKQELADEKTRVLLVCPGATATNFSKRSKIPPKMISEPVPPSYVVQKTVRAIGKKDILIVNNFDKLLYVILKFSPVVFIDTMIRKVQSALLKRANN